MEDKAKCEAVCYFKTMLGSPPLSTYHGIDALKPMIHERISQEHSQYLEQISSYEEIKDDMLSIHNNKAPSLEGFNAFFFKDTWKITSPLVTQTIREFFLIGGGT